MGISHSVRLPATALVSGPVAGNCEAMAHGAERDPVRRERATPWADDLDRSTGTRAAVVGTTRGVRDRVHSPGVADPSGKES